VPVNVPVSLRKNGVNTGIIVTIPASTAGIFEELLTEVDADGVDELCYRLDATANGGSGAMVVQGIGISVSPSSPSEDRNTFLSLVQEGTPPLL
jgi:hypothetical protein